MALATKSREAGRSLACLSTMEAMVNGRPIPTSVLEVPAKDSQLVGLPSRLRECAGKHMLEVWFECRDGVALCERLAADLLAASASSPDHPLYVRTTRPKVRSLGLEELVLDGLVFYRLFAGRRVREVVEAGWNTELQPFLVFVGPAEEPSAPGRPEGMDELCGARFAIACGADGHVAQLVPFAQSLRELRSMIASPPPV